MPALTTVLFDLDGTLIDSIQLIIDSYHHTLEVHGLPPRTDQEWLDGIGTPLRVQFAEERMEGMIATYRDYNIFHHDSRVTVYPGVVEMVQAVRAAGCRTGLVTSKNRVGAFRGLRLAGLEDAMDIVIGADEQMGGVENHWRGAIDDFLIIGRELSDAEIQSLAAGPS